MCDVCCHLLSYLIYYRLGGVGGYNLARRIFWMVCGSGPKQIRNAWPRPGDLSIVVSMTYPQPLVRLAWARLRSVHADLDVSMAACVRLICKKPSKTLSLGSVSVGVRHVSVTILCARPRPGVDFCRMCLGRVRPCPSPCPSKFMEASSRITTFAWTRSSIYITK